MDSKNEKYEHDPFFNNPPKEYDMTPRIAIFAIALVLTILFIAYISL